jgi:hypothetical protein
MVGTNRMKTIEATATVSPDGTLTVQVPPGVEVRPGEHWVVVVIEEASTATPRPAPLDDFPVIDVGPWPEGLSLRREDMYGDDGR